MSNEFDQAFEDATEEINKNLQKFKGNLEAGTADASSFMTISELEKHWKDLRRDNDKIYSDLVSTYLNNVEEKELIKRKK